MEQKDQGGYSHSYYISQTKTATSCTASCVLLLYKSLYLLSTVLFDCPNSQCELYALHTVVHQIYPQIYKYINGTIPPPALSIGCSVDSSNPYLQTVTSIIL